MIHMIWSGWVRKKRNKTNNSSYMLRCTILMQFNLEWKWSRENHSAQLLYPNRNEQSCSYLVNSTHTLGHVHLRRWGGGGGGGHFSMQHIWLLVWLSVHGFACWTTPKAILFSRSFHLLLDPVYRVSPASHTKCSVSAGTWYRQLYFSWYYGKFYQ